MSQRFLFIGGAAMLGAIVLAAAVILGGPGPKALNRTIDDPSAFRGTGFDPNRVGSSQPLPEFTEGGTADILRKGGEQLTQLFWQSSHRKPQGVWDVRKPAARIHLVPFRQVLQVQAMEGTFNVPDEQPRSGRFRNNVVVTFFDAPEGELANLSNDSPHIRLRLFLDEATFDLELGTIESDSPVHATSGEFDFRGTGLRLNYNPAKRQIDRLEILRGQQLRIRAAAFADARGEEAADEAAADPLDADAAPDKVAADEDAQAAEPLQYYRATLTNEVTIVNEETTIEADELAVIFAMSDEDMREGNLLESPEDAPDGTEANAPDAAANASPSRATESAAAREAMMRVPDPPSPQSLMPVGPDDLRITWRGPLVVTPQEQAPPELAHEKDVQLVMWGTPVRVHTAGDEPMTALAGSASYLSATRVLELKQGLHQPVVLDSAAGTMLAEHILIDQIARTGTILGAGELIAREDATDDEQVDAEAVAGAALEDGPPHLPSGLKVSWQERVDLTFYAHRPRREKDQSTDEPHEEDGLRMNALRGVTFIGEVMVRHPQLELDSGKLALAMSDPAAGRQTIEGLSAHDNVRVLALKDGADVDEGESRQELAIRTESLFMTMRPDEAGVLRPAHMSAIGHVIAEQPNHTLWADDLEIELNELAFVNEDEKDEADAADEKSEREETPPVLRMHARNNVRVAVKDRGVLIAADRLDANVPEHKLDLYAEGEQLVRVTTRDGELTGKHVTLLEDKRMLIVNGEGALAFALPEADGTDAAEGQATDAEAADATELAAIEFAPDPLRQGTIRWRESMTFDDLLGEAHFVGDVTADARNEDSTTHLAANQLHLKFDPPPDDEDADDAAQQRAVEVPPVAPPAPVVKQRPETAESIAEETTESLMDRMMGGDRTVRAVLAEGNAVFLTEKWDGEPGLKLATRTRLAGPSLAFDHDAQTIRIDGKGTMLVQDEREEPDGDDAEAEPQQPEAARPAQFSGRGATLFTWTGSLVLDAAANDMIIRDDVRMIHRPLGETQRVELDCVSFTADLEESGGLASWLDKKGPQPRLLGITADERVAITTQRYVITTDHLRYAGEDETVRLIADGDHVTQIIDETRPTPYTARIFTWDLRTDKFRIEKPGAGRAPVQ